MTGAGAGSAPGAGPDHDPAAEDPLPQVRARTSDRAFFPCLDGLRAIAALSVVVHHVGAATGNYEREFFGPLAGHMDIGVTVFFLLSGFLLYRPFVLAHLEDRPMANVRRFYRRRALRIVPAYWFALTVFIVVFGTVKVHSFAEGLAFYTFTQIYFRDWALSGMVQAWTLCVEVSFYLFLPLLAMAIRKLAIPRARRLRFELTLVAVLFMVGWTVKIVLLWHPIAQGPAELWLPAQLDLFALGMGLAVVSAAKEWSGWEPRWTVRVGAVPGVCWILAGLTFVVGSEVVGNARDLLVFTKSQTLGKAVYYALAALLLLLPAVFGPQDRSVVRRFLRAEVMAWLGLVSYGIYLWHKDIIDLLAPPDSRWGLPVVRDWVPHPTFLSILVLTLIFSIAAAAASWYFLERPIVRLGGRRRA